MAALKVLLVSCLWKDQAQYPWTPADAQKLADDCRSWYSVVSYGQLDLEFTVMAPWLRLAKTETEPVGYGSSVFEAELAQLTSLGYPASQYAKRVFLTTRNQPFGYKGLAWGVGAWVNCMGSDYALHSARHEIGHCLGLGHPDSLLFYGQVGNLLQLPPLNVTTGGDRLTDTDDVSSTMGYVASGAHFASQEKFILGWLTPTLFPGGDQTYTLRPLEQFPDAVKIACTMFLGSSRRNYWLEYRTGTIGQNGIQLRVENDFRVSPVGHINYAFPAGSIIDDGTIRMEVLSITPTEAVVRVRSGAPPVVVVPPPPPPAPPNQPPPGTQPPAPIGNANVIDSIITVAQAIKAAGNVATQAQKDQLAADVAAIVVGGTAPSPPPAGTSPAGTTIPPATSITDDTGAVWTRDNIDEVYRNGVKAGGFYASKIAWQPEARNGGKLSIAATNKGSGSVSYWDGSRWLWAGR